jgi:acetyl esterase/lipase
MANKSRHLVDPNSESLVNLPSGKLNRENLKFARAMPPLGLQEPKEPASVCYRKEVAKQANSDDVELLILESSTTCSDNKERPAILFIHGGGMITGSARHALYEMPSIIEKFDCLVASVEYRLAPEKTFPAQQQDLSGAFTWMQNNAYKLRIDPNNIIVMGVSAGGGLAAGLTHMLRDTDAKQLTAQVLIYPMLDARTGTDKAPVDNAFTGEYVWTRHNNQFGWESLRGDYELNDHRKAWFSPALAESLADLPPTYICTGALDLFMDESVEYARRLIDAGVSTELHVYPGAVHGFNVIEGSPLTEQYEIDLHRALKKFFKN